MFKIIAAAAGLIAIPYFLNLRDTAEAGSNLQVFFLKAKFVSWDWKSFTLKLKLTFKFINPTKSDLTLNYMFTKVKFFDKDGATLFVGSQVLNKKIKARETTTMNFDIFTPNLLTTIGPAIVGIVQRFLNNDRALWFQYKFEVNGLPDIEMTNTMKL